MKQLLGLIAATAILVPTAVSAQERIYMSTEVNPHAQIGEPLYHDTYCYETSENSNYYQCFSMTTILTEESYYGANEVNQISNIYRRGGGTVEVENKPQVGQLY